MLYEVITLDAGKLREFLVHEPFVVLDVLGHDPQQEIHVAEDHVTVEHFGVLAHGFREIRQVTAAVRRQLDVREHHRAETDLLPVENRRLVLDHSFLAQTLDAPPARGLRQADALADLGGVDPRLGLQQFEDTAIGLVEGNFLSYNFV